MSRDDPVTRPRPHGKVTAGDVLCTGENYIRALERCVGQLRAENAQLRAAMGTRSGEGPRAGKGLAS